MICKTKQTMEYHDIAADLSDSLEDIDLNPPLKPKSDFFSAGDCFGISEARENDVVCGIEVTPTVHLENDTLLTYPTTSCEMSNSWSISSLSLSSNSIRDSQEEQIDKAVEPPLFLNPSTTKSFSDDGAGSPIYERRTKKRSVFIDEIYRDLVFIGNIVFDEDVVDDHGDEKLDEKSESAFAPIQNGDSGTNFIQSRANHLFSDMFEQKFSRLRELSMKNLDTSLMKSLKKKGFTAMNVCAPDQFPLLLCCGLGMACGTTDLPSETSNSTLPTIEVDQGKEKIRLLLDTFALKYIIPKILADAPENSALSKELYERLDSLRENLVDLKIIEEEEEEVEDGVVDENIATTSREILNSLDALRQELDILTPKGKEKRVQQIIRTKPSIEIAEDEPNTASALSPSSSQASCENFFRDKELNEIMRATKNGRNTSALFPAVSEEDSCVTALTDDDGLGDELGALDDIEEDIRKELEATDLFVKCIAPSKSDSLCSATDKVVLRKARRREEWTTALESSPYDEPPIRRVRFASQNEEIFYTDEYSLVGSSSDDSDEESCERVGDLNGAWENFWNVCEDLIDELALACIQSHQEPVRAPKGAIRRSSVHL